MRRARCPAAGQHPGQPATGRHSALGRGTYAGHCRCRGVLLASTALWVHVGGPAPDALEVSLPGGRRSRLPYLVTRRGRLPHCDTTVIGGITCATIARAAVDIARLGTPVQAVQAILTARNHGVSRVRLLLTLNHCRGAASRGCPRAQHIIESVAFHQ